MSPHAECPPAVSNQVTALFTPTERLTLSGIKWMFDPEGCVWWKKHKQMLQTTDLNHAERIKYHLAKRCAWLRTPSPTYGEYTFFLSTFAVALKSTAPSLFFYCWRRTCLSPRTTTWRWGLSWQTISVPTRPPGKPYRRNSCNFASMVTCVTAWTCL